MFSVQQIFWSLPLVIVCASLGGGARALDFWMTAAELRQSLADTTISGQYVDARSFSEVYKSDGSLRYREFESKTKYTGRWSIVRDRFCTIYDQTQTGGCFRVRRISDNCFEFFFDSRTEAEARSSTLRNPTWTARAWRTDRISTCEERPLV